VTTCIGRCLISRLVSDVSAVCSRLPGSATVKPR
jgi:hypothetical protein